MNTTEFEKYFYTKRLDEFEKSSTLTPQQLQEAQIMLQIVADGYQTYPEQYKIMDEINIVERLKKLLKKYHQKELPPCPTVTKQTPKYDEKEYNMVTFCKNIRIYKKYEIENHPKIIKSLCEYTTWATQDSEAAYIFLLRDGLIPYLITKNATEKECYPLILGRKLIHYFFSMESKDEFDFNDSDSDKIYLELLYTLMDTAVVYNKNFDEFFKHLKPKFIKIIKSNDGLYNYLKNYLSAIKNDKIIVIESGRFGTMPLVLKCIDDRVDFRLFCAGPELYQIYEGKIYDNNGEKQTMASLIELEKIVSQNELFIFSSMLKNKQPMIKLAMDESIRKKSFDEITYAVNLYKNNYEVVDCYKKKQRRKKQ